MGMRMSVRVKSPRTSLAQPLTGRHPHLVSPHGARMCGPAAASCIVRGGGSLSPGACFSLQYMKEGNQDDALLLDSSCGHEHVSESPTLSGRTEVTRDSDGPI